MKKITIIFSFCFVILIINSAKAQISLWGMAQIGGANNMGVIFEYNLTTNSINKKFDFSGTANGKQPIGSLIKATNGKIYGLVALGGLNGKGVLFEYDHITNVYSIKHNFNGTDGERPGGSLIQATNGKLYGVAYFGGANNFGSLFEYDPATNIFTTKINFNATDGKYPKGNLIQTSNGKLYGLAYQGGANNFGTVFEYDITSGALIKKADFTGTNGQNSWGSLVEAGNGNLYGMTETGGVNNDGVLFEYNPTSSILTKKIDFNSTTSGRYPLGSLMKASNGKLYGYASWGGVNDDGTLFEYDPGVNTLTKKLDFDLLVSGSYPFGSLMQASNGKLYGLTKSGCTTNNGVLFEYDFNTSTYIKKVEFNGTNGSDPTHTQLLELPTITGFDENFEANYFSVFPNPSSGELIVEVKNNSYVTITDVLGRIIYSKQHMLGKAIIDLTKEANGIYFITVNSERQSHTKRLVINKR